MRRWYLALAAAGLASCVSLPTPAPEKSAAPAPAAAKPATPPGTPAPFETVVKGATETPGFFPLHRKDEKAWIAIRPEQFERPFFFTWNIPESVGERGLYSSQMGGARLAVFRKVGNTIQLIAKNAQYFAAEGTPQAQFVAQSFSDSLIASAPAASAPHPQSKAVLVEAGALLFGDIPGYLTRLETAFRLPYALDAKNTSIARASSTAGLTALQVRAHFAVPRIPAPPLAPSPATPAPTPPKSVPDPRSVFATFQYSFAELPAQPMRARPADERIGHFVSTRVDFTDDTAPVPRVQLVNRWRLEKKDPSAAISEPKEPITYWIDRNVPEKYRQAVADGILEWNKAFERAGFRNAVVVRQQREEDDFDTMDARHASVRWFTGADLGFAIGPSHKDPRTGEILDADIATGYGFTRGPRRVVAEDLGLAAAAGPVAHLVADPLEAHRHGAGLHLTCGYAWQSAAEFDFAMDLLETRGIGWDSPEADALAKANLKRNVMHEVGHTLGLRHNFRASSAYTLAQMQDPAFTRANGVVASVMEYMPLNIALKGEPQGEFVSGTLGPYDYWAIDYAYREIDAAAEKEELARIAARSTEPLLAYGTDEDAGSAARFAGIDPEVNRFDLGADPIEYFRKRMQLSRELWDRMQDLPLAPGESYERLTRSLASGLQQVSTVAPLAAKYVGGVRHLRDRAGTGRPLYEPTPPARQREALALITKGLFAPAAFRFRPEFLSRIGIDHFERPRNPDFSIATAVLNLQKATLDQLLDGGVAARLLDAPEKVAAGVGGFPLPELYATLQDAIWSELATGQEIPMLRRNLQREHLQRVATALVRPVATMPADARALQRASAVELERRLRAAASRPSRSKEERAHLNESLQTLSAALAAPLARSGV